MDGLGLKGNAGEATMRDFGGGLRPEPIAPSLPLAERPEEPGGPTKKAKIFAADIPQGEDVLMLEEALRPLAELAAHRDAEAPLTIALLGGAGVGKSFALAKLLARIETLSEPSQKRGGSPFLSPIATLNIDALSLSQGSCAEALAFALYNKLADAFPDLAREAAHAVRDPAVVAREAAEQLDIGRRRLDTERQNLAELEARRARLAETILFDQAGSQVDSYARANRGRIENRLVGFGITGDAVQNYKSVVRDIAEAGGAMARMGTALRAFWAFKGQTRLLVMAVVCVLIGMGCDAAIVHQGAWLAWLRGANQSFAPTADWSAAHIGWLQILKEVAFAGAAAAVFANIWRGVRFLRPLFRGVSLLEAEVAERRRDLDGLYAHQMRRVDALVADVELIGRRAAEADKRAAGAGGAKIDRQLEPSPFETTAQASQAERFLAAVAAAIERGWQGGEPVTATLLPQRICIALDNVDCLPQAQACDLLSAVQRVFAHPSFVTVIAADPRRFATAATAGTTAAAFLEKWIQIPFRVDAWAHEGHYAALIESALGVPKTERGLQEGDAKSEGASPKAGPAPLDWAISTEEVRLLTAVAPLAGRSPRAIKRFANLYRIARSQVPADKGILAFMLALDQGGSTAEIATVEEALAAGAPEAPFMLSQASSRLDAALAGIWANHSVTVASARRAATIAQAFSLRI